MAFHHDPPITHILVDSLGNRNGGGHGVASILLAIVDTSDILRVFVGV
jgi:hypothetical protein